MSAVMTTALRWALVEDHPLLAEALRHRLGTYEELELVAVAATGEQLLTQLAAGLDGVDVVLCDLSLPGELSGPALVAELTTRHPTLRVLVFTASVDAATISSCLDAGACGVVSKLADEAELVACLHSAAAGSATFDRHAASLILPAWRHGQGLPVLTDRELEVLVLMADGLTNAEIGARIHCSPLTVKSHVAHLLAKLEARDRAAAVARAIRVGLIA
jgi:two-component system, NarL family, response regulator DevR